MQPADSWFPTGLTLDSGNLTTYIDVLLDALESNQALVELIDNLSSGNTRRALDFVSTFVGSGYVQTSRILEAQKTDRPYIIPLHEFQRAILYGDHKYYDPSTSPIPNLFAVSTKDPKEHFWRRFCLQWCRLLAKVNRVVSWTCEM